MILHSVAGRYLYRSYNCGFDLAVCQYRSVTVSSFCLTYLIY